jgi:hypothetical protein
MGNNAPRPDWRALALTLPVPAVIVSSLVWFAVQPRWEESDEWLFAFFVLIGFEFVRVVVFWILRDAYRDYASPWRAVKFFAASVGVLATIALVIAVFELGVRDLFDVLTDGQTWRYLLPPALVILIDGSIGLYFFHGDARIQAARLDAAGDDARDWLVLAIGRLPFVAAALYALAIFLRSRGFAVPEWIRDPSTEAFRQVCLLSAAVYFCGKAILIAHVYTAHFGRTGVRLLSARWIAWFIGGANRAKRASEARAEAHAAGVRREALRGEADPESRGS